jgi:hypothetical protein
MTHFDSQADTMIVGHSAATQAMKKMLSLAANKDASVLLEGPTGAGKDVAAGEGAWDGLGLDRGGSGEIHAQNGLLQARCKFQFAKRLQWIPLKSTTAYLMNCKWGRSDSRKVA